MKKYSVWFFRFLKLIFLIVVCLLIINLFLDGANNNQISDYGTYYHGIQAALTDEAHNPYINLAPYPPYYSPPPSIFLLTPIYLMGLSTGKIVFTIFNIVLLLTAVRYLFRLLPVKTANLQKVFILLLFLLSYPVWFTVTDGQVNIILLLLVILGYYFVLKNNDSLAGIALGLGACLKITPLLLALYWLVNKRFKVFLAALGTFAVLSVVAGFQMTQYINYYYWRYIVFNVGKQGPESITNQSLFSFLYKNYPLYLVYQNYVKPLNIDLLSRQNFTALLNYSIVMLIILLVLLPSLKRFKSKPTPLSWLQLIEYSIVTIIAVLGSGLAWFHHYVILLFPLSVGWLVVMNLAQQKKRLVLFILLAVSTLLMNLSLTWQGKIFGDHNVFSQNTSFIGAVILFMILVKEYVSRKPKIT